MKLLGPTILALALTAFGCAPEPLAGLGDAGGGGSNNGGGDDMGGGVNNGVNNGMNNGGQMVTAEFQAVANIMIPSCLQAACHGQPPNGVFAVPTGVNATPEELAQALQVQTLTSDGQRLVAPGAPNDSNIYVRMNSTDPIKRMPPSPQLAGTDIMTVQTWIANGATFFQ